MSPSTAKVISRRLSPNHNCENPDVAIIGRVSLFLPPVGRSAVPPFANATSQGICRKKYTSPNRTSSFTANFRFSKTEKITTLYCRAATVKSELCEFTRGRKIKPNASNQSELLGTPCAESTAATTSADQK